MATSPFDIAPRGRDPVKGILGPDGRPYCADAPDGIKVPNVWTFGSLINQFSKTYSYRWSEAYTNSRETALAMRRDAFLMGLLRERQRHVEQMRWHIEPEDKKDERQVEECAFLEKVIRRTPYLHNYRRALNEDIWYGRAGVQQALKYDTIDGERAVVIGSHIPVNGDKIQFDWDGTPKVLIYAGAMTTLADAGATIQLGDYQPMIKLDRPYWRNRFVISKHDVIDADFGDPDKAGQIGGVGIRDYCYWLNWMKLEVTSWLMDFMERTGLGLTIYFYDAANQQGLLEAQKSAQMDGRNTVICYPRSAEGKDIGAGIERIETQTQGADVIIKMIAFMFDDKLERFIVGQTLSSSTEGSGLGGTGVAKMHGNTQFKIIKSDCDSKADTFTEELIKPLQRLNPKTKDSHYHYQFVFNVDEFDPEAKLKSAQIAYSMGVGFDEDELRGPTGFSKPTDDDNVLRQADPMEMMEAEAKLNPKPSPNGKPSSNGKATPEKPKKKTDYSRSHLDFQFYDGNGKWVTIHGTHVYIEDGKIIKGPAHLKGLSHEEAHEANASKKSVANDRKSLKEDDPIHSYLGAFNDKSQDAATAKDARQANRELKSEDSKFRLVPDGEGGWEPRHASDLTKEFGARWTVTDNPLTGQIDVGDKDYFDELETLAGNEETKSYLHAFNDPMEIPPTSEEVDQANKELAGDESNFRIIRDKEHGLWVAKIADDYARSRLDFQFYEDLRKEKLGFFAQCRRTIKVGEERIEKAVKKFLKGVWVEVKAAFDFAIGGVRIKDMPGSKSSENGRLPTKKVDNSPPATEMDIRTVTETVKEAINPEKLKEAVKPDLERLYVAGMGLELDDNVKTRIGAYSGRAAWDEPFSKLKKKLPLELQDETRFFLEKTFAQPWWDRLPGTVGDQLAKTLSKGTLEGETIDGLVGRLQNAYADLTEIEARRISRTETTGAINAGLQAARVIQYQKGLVKGKRWESMGDEDVRHMHDEADGQEVMPLDQFIVGDETCMYPGDMKLSPANRCNCRCLAQSVPMEVPLEPYQRNRVAEFYEDKGHWVTMHGEHVFIGKGGKITKGPAHLIGHTKTSSIAAHWKHKEKLDKEKKAGKTKESSPADAHATTGKTAKHESDATHKQEAKKTVAEIAKAHIREKGVGISFDELYDKAKDIHPDLTKEDFRVMMHEFHEQGDLFRLGGWMRMHTDLPDPELAVHIGGEKTRDPRENVDRSKAPDLDRVGRLMWFLQPRSGSQQYSRDQDADGRWVTMNGAHVFIEAANAMKHAHPYPEGPIPHLATPGLGRPIHILEKVAPEMIPMRQEYDDHMRAWNRALAADKIHEMLASEHKLARLPSSGESKGRQKSLGRKAIDAESNASFDAQRLSHHWDEVNEQVASVHPKGKDALEAARAESIRRHEDHIQRLAEHRRLFAESNHAQ